MSQNPFVWWMKIEGFVLLIEHWWKLVALFMGFHLTEHWWDFINNPIPSVHTKHTCSTKPMVFCREFFHIPLGSCNGGVSYERGMGLIEGFWNYPIITTGKWWCRWYTSHRPKPIFTKRTYYCLKRRIFHLEIVNKLFFFPDDGMVTGESIFGWLNFHVGIEGCQMAVWSQAFLRSWNLFLVQPNGSRGNWIQVPGLGSWTQAKKHRKGWQDPNSHLSAVEKLPKSWHFLGRAQRLGLHPFFRCTDL